MSIPEFAKVLVVGGGPSGSYAASCLARENIDVVVLEADVFPRYHVGESMIASMRHFLRFIDLDETFTSHGFKKKVGAAFKFGHSMKEGYTNFIEKDPESYAWNVVRSEADKLMLDHSEKQGAKVFQGTKVVEFQFEGEGASSRPLSATWKSKDGKEGKIAFDFIIDASGRRGILSTSPAINTRTYNQSLRNIASWGYWTGAGCYAPGTSRSDSPYFEALRDESGWAWFIPLHDGTTSVGIVMNQEVWNQKKAASGLDLTTFYNRELKDLAPNLTELLGTGTLGEKEGTVIRSASDYSYSASSYAGLNWRCIGDASAFIDPYFSSGVHLSLSGGLAAAASIASVIRGEISEEEGSNWHTARIGTSYTRFLVVVLSAYGQIRNQAKPILADVNEKDFDRAFGHFRNIIQGRTEVTTAKLSQEELKNTIEFCSHAFDATSDTGKGEARKVVRMEDTMHINHIVADTLEGFSLRLERGNLGLNRA